MEIVKICNALGNEIRYQIVKSLKDQTVQTCCDRIEPYESGVCVDDVVIATGLAQSTVSQHLQVLVDSGVICKEKRGKWTCFFLDLPLIDTFFSGLNSELQIMPQSAKAAVTIESDMRVRAVNVSDFDIEMD